MNRLNFIFKTQAEYDQLVTDGQLIPGTHYFISVGGNKFRQNYVNAAGTVYEKEDLAGLDETALATYLTTNGYITQSQLNSAIADFVTSTELQTEVDALNQSITAAQTAANNAQTTADQAVTDAAAALTAANNAQTTADQGVTDAAAALTAANNAQTTADDAQTTADSALTNAGVAMTDAANALTQVAALAIAVRLGLRSIVANLGSVQTAIDAAITAAEEGTYCATVLGTDDTTPETITVGGVTLELNTSCAVYFKIDNNGAVSDVHLDNNSALARVITLEGRVTAAEEIIKKVTQRQLTYVYNIADLGGEQDIRGLVSGAQNGVDDLHAVVPNVHTCFIFKGAGTCVITDYFGTDVTTPTAITVKDGDILNCLISKSQTGYVVHNAGMYYPAPTDISAFVASMPLSDVKMYGTAFGDSMESILTENETQLGTAANSTTKKITICYRTTSPSVNDVVTFTGEDGIETWSLGDDSLVQFQAIYSSNAWVPVSGSLKVSTSYNALQQGTFS